MSDDKYAGLGLSDEEIAAMEEELSESEGADVKSDESEVDDEGQDVVKAGENADGADDTDDSGVDADDSQKEDASPKDDDPRDASAQQKDDVFVADEKREPVPDKFTAELDRLSNDMSDLKKKFDDGEIAIDEYMDARFALERKIVKLETAKERDEHDAAKSWDKSQKDFLGTEASSFLRESDVIYDAFAMQVNKLIADPKSASMSDDALLKAARDKVYAAFRISQESQPSPKKDESAIREAKKEAADRGKAPKTLQGMPAAAPADDTDTNPFAYLDRLSGDKLEAALMKLSAEDQERWAHSQ